ncbi:response regulator [Devosia sp. PTR5]|uniref:Response regulator n=1 Tax=Devosia oryzisoli TaxID=2774138 RepID=A0A927IS07_9HYPH|nr:response regulator [Devosia oryzisoli]MBD8067275.1 response regulator [Devosia oryzisoli]
MAVETITKRGVLIIDPQPNMANLVATMARSVGRRDIRIANEASQALVELRRRLFDVVILDDALIGADATEFVRKLRASRDCQNRLTPIIMMAASPDAHRIAAARDAGINEFLRKPFSAVHLKARLDTIAAAPRAFIEATRYIGPDRRRRTVSIDGDRRSEPGATDP